MRFIWSLLAIIGLISLGCVGFLAFKFSPLLSIGQGRGQSLL